MKILLVITKGELGGAQSFVLSLAKGLQEAEQDVFVACGDGEFLINKLRRMGIKVFQLKSLERSGNPFKAISFIFELRRLINQEKFEVIHLNSSNTLFGAVSAKFSSVRPKIIFTVHGLSVLDDNYQASFIVKSAYRLFFKVFFTLVDRVAFVSRVNLEAAKKLGITSQGEVIYNGLDFLDGYFLDQKAARKILSDRIGKNLRESYLIGSIGRLAYPKNYESLIRAFPSILAKRPDAKGVIIGEGKERGKYEKMIKENKLGDSFFLVGAIEEAGCLVRAFDRFVLPSLYEGLSISLIEAVKAGVPAIASDVGGNREIIGEENCFRLDQGDGIAALALREAVNNSVGERFSASDMVKKYLLMYEV